MTNKAYIVANKEQELEVLNEFEENEFVWMGGELPTEWVTSEEGLFVSFPYMLIEREDGKISWSAMDHLEDETVVYDGRKEEKMYKVTQEFMNELIKWRYADCRTPLTVQDLALLPVIISSWCFENESPIENSNRLIAIIEWLNGEDVFEVEEPNKLVVRSKKSDNDGDYIYVQVKNDIAVNRYYVSGATRFDTREEAQEWANSHQVVIEIDEDGNEVQ